MSKTNGLLDDLKHIFNFYMNITSGCGAFFGLIIGSYYCNKYIKKVIKTGNYFKLFLEVPIITPGVLCLTMLYGYSVGPFSPFYTLYLGKKFLENDK